MNIQFPKFRFSLDPYLLIPALVLCTIGILSIYSSGINSLGLNTSNEYARQIIWVIFGLFLAAGVSFIKYDYYREFALAIFSIGILLVVASLLFGKVVNGAKSWLGIGELGIQPSEFLKLAYIIFFASIIDRNQDTMPLFRTFIIQMLLLLVPVGLILLQPDFGTAMVFFPMFLSMSFFGGTKKRYIVFILSIVLVSALFILIPAWDTYINKSQIGVIDVIKSPFFIILFIGLWTTIAALAIFGLLKLKRQVFYWIIFITSIILISFLIASVAFRILKEYQMLRLVVFMDPNIDPKGSGWHIIQSLTAVGSGGFSGKGYLQGTQSHYKFLPEQSTDFIFSIISEEFGFLGGLAILVSFGIIIGRILYIMKTAKDSFAVSLCAGLIGMILFHVIINIGMTIGLMPITGIPLLLVSYGGSSMMTSMLALGLASSINAYRYNY